MKINWTLIIILSLFSHTTFAQDETKELNWTFEYNECYIRSVLDHYHGVFLSAKVQFHSDSIMDPGMVYIFTGDNRLLKEILYQDDLALKEMGMDSNPSKEQYIDYMDSIYRLDLVVPLSLESYQEYKGHFKPIHYFTENQSIEPYLEKDPIAYSFPEVRSFLPQYGTLWHFYLEPGYPHLFHWFFINRKFVYQGGEDGALRCVSTYCE